MIPTFKVVIPARYAATRLPGKPLREIAGRPMLAHVCDRARESGASEVVVATDDTRIQEALAAEEVVVCMTSPDHQSGTDRIAEVVAQRQWAAEEIVVNLQGDEPLMPPELLGQVASNLAAHPEAAMATLATPVRDMQELFNPNAVKVVWDDQGMALYFSRAAIPWDRDGFAREGKTLPSGAHYRHLGIYAYRAGFIQRYVSWAPTRLEQLESLEQLRALEQGAKIHVAEALKVPGPGVDTEQDLREVSALLAQSD